LCDLKIGDLAKLTHKTTRALRLYEELGLLTPGTRTAGGFRVYGPEAIERVTWIGKLQELGFTLQQIQELVDVTAQSQIPREAMAKVRGLFHEKLDDVAQQIARLTQLRRELSSSLAYLETCVACAHDDTGMSACSGCADHGTARAPSLVEGVRPTRTLHSDAGTTSPDLTHKHPTLR
jgi:DNA-binding transcriptional MerR regulator